jgi:hypothetical protein
MMLCLLCPELQIQVLGVPPLQNHFFLSLWSGVPGNDLGVNSFPLEISQERHW